MLAVIMTGAALLHLELNEDPSFPIVVGCGSALIAVLSSSPAIVKPVPVRGTYKKAPAAASGTKTDVKDKTS